MAEMFAPLIASSLSRNLYTLRSTFSTRVNNKFKLLFLFIKKGKKKKTVTFVVRFSRSFVPGADSF